jgi:putative intracellular protease/amidase
MKRLLILALAAMGSVSILAACADAGQSPKVLMIVPDGSSGDLELMLTAEVGVMTNLLEQSGFEVVVASTSGEPLTAEHTTLTPDKTFADVRVADYAGVIVPCLAIDTDTPLNPAVAAIIQGAVAEGKPVAAQTSSVIMLAKAGVLSGKRYAYVAEWAGDASIVEGATYGGTGIVQDGKILTSGICPFAARGRGLPDGTTGLVEALIAELQGQG